MKGGKDNRDEKQLMIIIGEGEFDQDVLIMGNNFKLEYEELLEAYNRRQCAMVLIKNMVATSKGDQFLQAQHYTIFNKLVDEGVRACLLQLHNKLSSTRPTFKEINFILFVCTNFVFLFFGNF
jgi:hypothetical protein